MSRPQRVHRDPKEPERFPHGPILSQTRPGPEGKHGQNPVSGRTTALRLLELSQWHRSEHDRKVQEERSSISLQELASANRQQKLPPPERLACLRLPRRP